MANKFLALLVAPGVLASPSNFLGQRGTATCPDWATGKGTYSFVKSEWGRTTQTSGTKPARAPYGLAGDINHPGDAEMNTACAWISACKGNDECMKRCPVAMAIGAKEGGWFPGAYAWDGNGRGLWQVNYATAQLPGDCAYHPKEGEIPEPSFTGEDGQVHNCDLYDPIKEATLVIKYTSNGKDFNPPGKCWSTCSTKCADGAPGYDGIGGPKLAEEAQDSCTAAIHSITGKSVTNEYYDQIDQCDLIHEKQCFCPAPHSMWACDPDNTDPFKCGSGGGQCVCSPGDLASPLNLSRQPSNMDLASASNFLRQRGNIASTATCPDWATGKGTYSFVKSEWGRTTQTSGTNPATAPYGLAGDINHPGDAEMNTACAWISACKGNDECMKRCPVAMAIGAKEGGWFPGAYAWDGNGRGLWQVNYATAQLPGDCAYHPKEGEIPEPSFTGEDGQVHNCDLYDPIKEATLVIKYTSNGKDFNPPGKCWSTCSKKCANGAPGYDGIGGPKLAEEAQDSCTAAIHSITGKSVTNEYYDQIDQCDLIHEKQCHCPAPNPTWACDPHNTDPFKCGSGGGQCVCH